jgi:holo-[acyl-carrier protein] synthase
MNSILGIGVDSVEVDRIGKAIERSGDRFVERILTPGERAHLANLHAPNIANFVAKRFAAKEAVSKALGTGIRGVVSFQAFEVMHTPAGQPVLLANAQIHCAFGGIPQVSTGMPDDAAASNDRQQSSFTINDSALRFHLSLTDSARLVTAFVVIERLSYAN